LNIFDFFAGRGRYAEGQEGSPLIIMKAVAEVRKRMGRSIDACCIFIEKNVNNFQNLKDEVEKERESHPDLYGVWLETEFHNDEFGNVASKIISQLSRTEKTLAPSLFFIDPFGFGGVQLKTIKVIMSIEHTEAFITFMTRDVNRFLESPRHRIKIEELYGVRDVARILEAKYRALAKEQALLRFYRDQIHDEAQVSYTLSFKVGADEKLQTTYDLIHATNHPKGCELMKEIMYKTGTEGRFGYFGPSEGQMLLTQIEGIPKLKEYLFSRFRGKTLTYQDVRYETLMETEFIKKHYLQAINELQTEGKITVKGRGPRGGLSEDSSITFGGLKG
jgi:three-Cys-motif partner protein